MNNHTTVVVTQVRLVILVMNVIMLVALYFALGMGEQGQTALFVAIGLGLTLATSLVVAQVVGKALNNVPDSEPLPTPVPPKPEPLALPKPSPAPAIQLLSLLQRKGRLLDFLQEDIRPFTDAQIGAAVRNVHEGCKEALAESVVLEPIYDVSEGSAITVPADFDAKAVRLTGSVTGEPPFNGSVQHRGWRVAEVKLPEQLPGKDADMVVAPAEVEVR
ncbi:MAG: hypothetical protein RhofKO_31400 [Rhodothermales bacterium]